MSKTRNPNFDLAVAQALESLEAKGLVKSSIDPNGERRYLITQAGIEYQESLRKHSSSDCTPFGAFAWLRPSMFASQHKAYETLSEGMKRLLQGLRAWHGGRNSPPCSESKKTVARQSHPIVRIHPETGRKGLYVNPLHTYCIDGLTEAESRGLLDFLFEDSWRPDFTIGISG